jgi:hypothetical protein
MSVGIVGVIILFQFFFSFHRDILNIIFIFVLLLTQADDYCLKYIELC